MVTWIHQASRALTINANWMTWNLFLALIPLVLSIWLFRLVRQRSLFWLVGCLVFVAFLPNAPYILTDIIHLIENIRRGYSVWIITLVLVPQYLLVMLIGFEAYVLSLMNLGHYLKQKGWGKYIVPAELFLHSLSAVGIYLGRFERFNSWDIVTKPGVIANTLLDELVAKRPVLVMAITFGVLTTVYWLVKQLNLAVLTYRRTARVASLLNHSN